MFVPSFHIDIEDIPRRGSRSRSRIDREIERILRGSCTRVYNYNGGY